MQSLIGACPFYAASFNLFNHGWRRMPKPPLFRRPTPEQTLACDSFELRCLYSKGHRHAWSGVSHQAPPSTLRLASAMGLGGSSSMGPCESCCCAIIEPLSPGLDLVGQLTHSGPALPRLPNFGAPKVTTLVSACYAPRNEHGTAVSCWTHQCGM